MDTLTIVLIIVGILLFAGFLDIVFGLRIFLSVLETMVDMLMWISIFNLFSDD